MPVGCKALCWGIPPLRYYLVILQQMQCSKVFIIPNFILIIFCFGVFLLCCTVIEVYARWVWSFMLRYPFFKALVNHITADAVFQSIYNPNFIIFINFSVIGFLLCVLWLGYLPVGYESGKYVALGGNTLIIIVIKVYRFYSLSCMVYHKSLQNCNSLVCYVVQEPNKWVFESCKLSLVSLFANRGRSLQEQKRPFNFWNCPTWSWIGSILRGHLQEG